MELANFVFINCFEVPVGREDAFYELWDEIDEFMIKQPGFKYKRLHKSIDDNATLRFVNIVGWDSIEQFDAAHVDEFRAMWSRPGWSEFAARPSLYTIVQANEGNAGE
ncbi:antibiotic biosynthesis monooxygenase family protein [Streptomyces sp. NPDC092369]|uniref:antibiotic biosynthesis monooxygenase family protein n=1 Tax=Streptomyces sp. NPDC092369 TaxID=3366015 RepID=UPI0038034B93